MTATSESKGISPTVPMLGAAFVLLTVAVTFAVVTSICLKQTEGHFSYGLDDPYIHLAIAKNVAHHGIWGVTEFAPSSASSSPLWTVMIALAIIVGGNLALWPFILGVIFSVAATLFAYFRLLRSGLNSLAAAVTAILIYAIGPLFMLPFTGMEHSLQIFLDLIFGFWLLDLFARKSEKRDFWFALGVTVLMCTCRYESVSLVLVPIGVCLWRLDWRIAAGLALGPVIGIGGFGLYSHLSGMPWVPNSILTKGHLPHSSIWDYITGLGNRMYWNISERAPILGCLMLVAVFVLLMLRTGKLKGQTASLQIWLSTILVASAMHAGFAMMGFLYRYEGYLLVSLTAGVGLGAWELFREYGLKSRIAVVAPALLVVLTSVRAVKAFDDIPNACSDIYLQQNQMARFVHRYYPTGRLAANDIGAVTYFSDIHLLDLVGLATDSIRRARVSGTYNTAVITREIDKFKPDLVIAYPDWFTRNVSLPGTLIPVADWKIPPITSAACPLVRFYATTRAAADRLHRELVEFQPQLPQAVKVVIY